MPVEGDQVVKQALHDYRLRKSKALLIGLMKAGLQLQADAQKLCPVDTGRLKGSAKTELNTDGSMPEVEVTFQHHTHCTSMRTWRLITLMVKLSFWKNQQE